MEQTLAEAGEPITVYFTVTDAIREALAAEGLPADTISLYRHTDGGNVTRLIQVPAGQKASCQPDSYWIENLGGVQVIGMKVKKVTGLYGFGIQKAYTVTVEPAENGSAASDHDLAAAGTTVTITASPAAGYQASGVTVTAADGSTITATYVGNGQYQFVMPAKNVTVTAAFQKASGGGSHGSDDSNWDFWQKVREEIEDSESCATIEVDAKHHDRMPVSVMEALREHNVNLIIHWKGGEDIIIPAGEAQPYESYRVYYPLSLLEKLYAGMKVSDCCPGSNPETGGPRYIEAPDGEAPAAVTPAEEGVLYLDPSVPVYEYETEAAPVDAGTAPLWALSIAAFALAAAALLLALPRRGSTKKAPR